MRIQLSSSSDSSPSKTSDDGVGLRSARPIQENASFAFGDTSSVAGSSQQASGSHVQLGAKGTRRRSHHLERVTALRKASARLVGSGTPGEKDDANRRSPGPRWMHTQSASPDDGKSPPTRKSVSFRDEAPSRLQARRQSSSSDSDSSLATTDDDSNASSNDQSRQNVCRAQREASAEAQEVASRIRLGSSELQSQRRRITSLRMTSPDVVSRPSLTASARASHALRNDDLDDVQKMLERMRVQQQRDESSERQAFEARNKALWDSIEKGIAREEQARKAAEREAQERARKAKEQEEAARRRAQEAREAEEKRKQEAEAAERQRKGEEERQARSKAEAEALAAKEKEASEARERNAGSTGDGLVREAAQEYELWRSKMAHIKEKVLPAVSSNAEWRKQCFAAKRQITRGIGQLTNSREEVVRITRSISDVLTQARWASPAGEIYTWILNHLAKCLIRQAEQETAAKQDTAFPLAHVVVWLLLEGHSELGEVLMARLNKKCCWVLAYCPPKRSGEEDGAYAKRLGKASVEEASQQHTARMSGISALYYAIAQTSLSPPPSGAAVDKSRIPAHFRIGALWKWQARAMAPSFLGHTLTPALWSVLIEMAGPRLLIAFGKQTGKLWRLLLTQGLQQGKAGFTTNASANSAKVRLQLLLDDWAKSSQVMGATGGREMDA